MDADRTGVVVTGREQTRRETETRIRRDNDHDTAALARHYALEDSDRGFLARQILRLIDERDCVCGETSARNCPVHGGGR